MHLVLGLLLLPRTRCRHEVWLFPLIRSHQSCPSLSVPAQPVVDDAESVRTSHRSKKPTQFFCDPLRHSVKSVEEDPTLPSETVLVLSTLPRKPLIRDRFPPGPSMTTSPPLNRVNKKNRKGLTLSQARNSSKTLINSFNLLHVIKLFWLTVQHLCGIGGAINHLLVWVQFFLFLKFWAISQNFSPAKSLKFFLPSVPRYLIVFLQSHCKLMKIVLADVILLIHI